jgi:phosphatidylethanolamine/phosphatidyl-N-methylethanolamine N-methyltransferase
MPARPNRKGADGALFFRHWLRRPLGIGAILPSSDAVARAMASDVPFDRPGAVLELGGGTGVVTRGLIDAGCPPERLIVVEREPALADILRRRFAAARVVKGDACAIGALLAELGVTQLAAVVSSLPIKWFPLASQRAVVEPCFDLLGEDGMFLQLTNALVSPLAMRSLGLDGTEVARVWSQFPPVQIWRYQRRPAMRDANRKTARNRAVCVGDRHVPGSPSPRPVSRREAP